jgi:hypothetical protein
MPMAGGPLPVAVSVTTAIPVAVATTIGPASQGTVGRSGDTNYALTPSGSTDQMPPKDRSSATPRGAPAPQRAAPPQKSPAPAPPNERRSKKRRSKSSADTHSGASSKSLSDLLDWGPQLTVSAAEQRRQAMLQGRKMSRGPLLTAGALGAAVLVWAAISVLLPPSDGTLTIQVSAPNASLMIDDQPLDVAWGNDGKEAAFQLASGKHQITVRKQGYQDFNSTVVVQANIETFVLASLTPIKPPSVSRPAREEPEEPASREPEAPLRPSKAKRASDLSLPK